MGHIPRLVFEYVLTEGTRLVFKVKAIGVSIVSSMGLLFIKIVSVVINRIENRRDLYVAAHIPRDGEKHHSLLLWPILKCVL